MSKNGFKKMNNFINELYFSEYHIYFGYFCENIIFELQL